MLWDDTAKMSLEFMWNAGLSCSKIAELLGPECSKNCVVGKAHRMGLPERRTPIIRVSPEEDAERRMPSGRLRRKGRARPPIAGPTLSPLAELGAPVVATLPPLPSEITMPSRPPPKRQLPRAASLSRVHECQFPIGDVGTPNFRFCLDPTQEGSSYCPTHHRICWVRPGGLHTADQTA